MTWRAMPRLRYAETAASKYKTRCAQFAQAKVFVIAPSKGSEHLAQKGETIRDSFVSQSAHKYSEDSTGAAQIVQLGGDTSEAEPRMKTGAAIILGIERHPKY